jgi:hypothetical protein
MTAPVLHIGPLAPEGVAYLLALEIRLGRADDWRHDCKVVVRDEALAAERRVPA